MTLGLRWLVGAAVVLAVLWVGAAPLAVAPPEGCVCATARETNGWCPVHQLGYVGGVKVTSPWLYEAADAHGHKVDLTTYPCPSCQKAIATNGFCEAHHIGFLGGLAYYSRLTYELAKGEVRPTSAIACPTCRRNSETYGWCAKSRVGMVGPFAITNREDFDLAVEAVKIFMAANEAARRCHYCAVAMITDTECPVCRITYKNGKALPRDP